MKRLFTTVLQTIIVFFVPLTATAQNSTCAAPSGPMPQPGDPPICYPGYTVENTGPLTQYYTFIATTPAMQVMLLPVVGTACSFPNTAIFYSNLRLYALGDCMTPLAYGALFFGLTPGDTYIWGCTMTPADPICVWIAEACPSVVPSPLPVNLTHLEANAMNNHVKVNWSVATGGVYQHFRVQSSNSPDLGFTDAGEPVTAEAGQQEFEFFDENLQAGKQLFYRLIMVEESGASEVSEVVEVKSPGAESWITIYPNPSQGSSEVLISGDQQVSFRITQMNGKVVEAADEPALQAWMQQAAPGVYVIEGSRADERTMIRWIRI